MTKFDTLLCSKRNYWSGPIFKKQNKKKLVCSLDFCFSLVFVRMEGKKKFCKISIWSKFMKFSFGWRGRKWVLSSNIIDFLRWRESFSAFIQRVKYFFFFLPFPTALCLYLCRQVKISIFTVCMGIDGCVFSLFYFGPLVASRPKSSILLK